MVVSEETLISNRNFHQYTPEGKKTNCRIRLFNSNPSVYEILPDLGFVLTFWLSVFCLPALLRSTPVRKVSKVLVYTTNGLSFLLILSEMIVLTPFVACYKKGETYDKWGWIQQVESLLIHRKHSSTFSRVRDQ